jgi:hypothetical protein
VTSAIVLSSMLDRLLNTRIDPHRSQMDIDRRRLANSCLMLWNDYGKRGALALLCEPTDELCGKVLAVSGATSVATEQDLPPWLNEVAITLAASMIWSIHLSAALSLTSALDRSICSDNVRHAFRSRHLPCLKASGRPVIRLFVRRRSGSGISIISPQAIRGRMFGSAG